MRLLLSALITALVFVNAYSETLFEIKDSSNQTVFNISEDGLRVFNLGDTLMVISASNIKANLGTGKGLSRTFSVTTNSAKGNSDVFKVSSETAPDVVDMNTMLWYPQKNAFRVGKVQILAPDSVGTNSFASGYNSQAKGEYSQSMGFEAVSNGTYAMAVGQGAKAMGISSTAVGQFANAKGQSSIALGNASATNTSAIAAGNGSLAEGQNSTAIGYNARATGSESFSLGPLSFANAYRSFAWGNTSYATGNYSVAFGQDVESQSYYGAAFGRFNIVEGSTSSWVTTDPIFVVGNGTSSSAKSNALTLLKNGNMGLGTNVPGSNRLKVLSNASVTNVAGATGYFENSYSAGMGLAALATTTDVALYAENKNTSSTTANIVKFASMYGGSWSEKFSIRSSGRIYASSLSSGTGTALYLTSGNEIVKLSSSKMYKKDIVNLNIDKDKFMKLRPVSFKWNENSASENKPDYGLIAEEVEETDPELAVYGTDGNLEGVNYQKINIMLLKVVQDQQKKMDRLEQENSDIRNELNEIRKLIGVRR